MKKRKVQHAVYLTRNIIHYISMLLHLHDIARMRIVCKDWKKWIDSDHILWQSHATRLRKLFHCIVTPSVELLKQFPPLFSEGKSRSLPYLQRKAAARMQTLTWPEVKRIVYSLIGPHQIRARVKEKRRYIDDTDLWYYKLRIFHDRNTPHLTIRMPKKGTHLYVYWGGLFPEPYCEQHTRSAYWYFDMYKLMVIGKVKKGAFADWFKLIQ